MNIERHPSIIREPWDTSLDKGIPPATQGELVPTETTANADPDGRYGQTIVDPVTARILARLLAKESLQDPGYLSSTAGYKGAPLSGSGPASVIATLALIPAGIWTIRRARKLERFTV